MPSLKRLRIAIGVAWLMAAAPLAAQWLHLPTAGIPRTADGKPDLAAPAPRTADGHPDLSGIWFRQNDGHLENLAIDGQEVVMRPWAAALFQERLDNFAKDRPSGRCLPHSVADFDAHFTPRKLIQMPGLIVMLFEGYHTYRQIFVDGRSMPKDLEPAWFGYSVGRWDGDTLVVDTIGISDHTWLDDSGHPHTMDMRLTERFRRVDFGHMDVQLTIDDAQAYAKPWSVALPWQLMPDTELVDWVCENEKDLNHLVGK
jgi:hypothetical protein